MQGRNYWWDYWWKKSYLHWDAYVQFYWTCDSDTSRSSWHFKGAELLNINADLTTNSSQSFKYKATLVGKTADAVKNTNSSVKNKTIIVPLKYLRNFWKSLEMPLINCKVYL